MVNKDWYIHI